MPRRAKGLAGLFGGSGRRKKGGRGSLLGAALGGGRKKKSGGPQLGGGFGASGKKSKGGGAFARATTLASAGEQMRNAEKKGKRRGGGGLVGIARGFGAFSKYNGFADERPGSANQQALVAEMQETVQRQPEATDDPGVWQRLKELAANLLRRR